MANVDAPLGLRLITGGSRKAPRIVRRQVDGASTAMAPGDCYTVANSKASRAGTSAAVNGVMVAVDVPGAAVGEGPMTYDYVPENGAQYILGIEDADAEFEVQWTTGETPAATDFDAGSTVDLLATACSVGPPAQSREEVQAGVDSFLLVRLVDRPGNAYGEHAKVVVKLRPANVI